ncbi:MAG: DUF4167 domain-containing protein [Aestuariivirga sp.]|nr:DUF4167 domain-containing protein [Aestuariivirga sp.]
MNFDNGHRARQGQHNNKRGRGRNNRRPGGGGGGGSHNNGGGNSTNRVYESNGPDVKVRGTAQTVAEKYMQLGRDAQSSGDNVMAESYFQFSEHYFRVMAAAQPVGQPTTQLRRPEDEDFEEEGGDAAEGETETAQAAMVSEGGQSVTGEQADSGGESSGGNRPRDNRDGNRERFRPRWQNRGDQPRDGDSEPRVAEAEPQMAQESTFAGRPSGNVQDADTGQWEAPSFLRRPAPVEVADEPVAEKKGRNPRRARAVTAEDGE